MQSFNPLTTQIWSARPSQLISGLDVSTGLQDCLLLWAKAKMHWYSHHRWSLWSKSFHVTVSTRPWDAKDQKRILPGFYKRRNIRWWRRWLRYAFAEVPCVEWEGQRARCIKWPKLRICISALLAMCAGEPKSPLRTFSFETVAENVLWVMRQGRVTKVLETLFKDHMLQWLYREPVRGDIT